MDADTIFYGDNGLNWLVKWIGPEKFRLLSIAEVDKGHVQDVELLEDCKKQFGLFFFGFEKKSCISMIRW